jgi:hypothetical protein
MDPSHIDLSNSYIQFLIVSTIVVGIAYALYRRQKTGEDHEWE